MTTHLHNGYILAIVERKGLCWSKMTCSVETGDVVIAAQRERLLPFRPSLTTSRCLPRKVVNGPPDHPELVSRHPHPSSPFQCCFPPAWMDSPVFSQLWIGPISRSGKVQTYLDYADGMAVTHVGETAESWDRRKCWAMLFLWGNINWFVDSCTPTRFLIKQVFEAYGKR